MSILEIVLVCVMIYVLAKLAGGLLAGVKPPSSKISCRLGESDVYSHKWAYDASGFLYCQNCNKRPGDMNE